MLRLWIHPSGNTSTHSLCHAHEPTSADHTCTSPAVDLKRRLPPAPPPPTSGTAWVTAADSLQPTIINFSLGPVCGEQAFKKKKEKVALGGGREGTQGRETRKSRATRPHRRSRHSSSRRRATGQRVNLQGSFNNKTGRDPPPSRRAHRFFFGHPVGRESKVSGGL